MNILTVKYKKDNKVVKHIVSVLQELDEVSVDIEEDETLMSKKDFFAMIDRSIADYESGNFVRVTDEASLREYLDSL